MSDLDLRRFTDKAALITAVTDYLETCLSGALDARGRASLMLSGGSSPAPIYKTLAQRHLPWDGVGISLVDERWVPSGHAASNADFIQSCLTDSPAMKAHFVPLYNGHEMATDGVPAATQALALMAQPFDVCVLGMGMDAHTASWFRETADIETLLSDDNPHILAAVDASGCDGAGLITERITLTYSAIKAARHSVLFLSNPEKLAVFETALTKAPQEAPVSALTGLGNRLTIFALETSS
jgi:6-phosphogluconolactonase